MLVSIIVPVYNAEQNLKACIDSIINQKFEAFEIVLVDDGSIDLSGEICEEYAKKYNNVKVIHSPNCGVSAARNKGLEVSIGEYVMFVDSDDILLPGAVNLLYQEITEKEADICIGQINIIKNGREVKKCRNTGKIEVLHDSNLILQCILDDRFYSCYGKIIKCDLAKKVRFVEGRKIHEDGFYIFQCLLLSKCVVISDMAVYLYYIHSKSASHVSFSDKFYDITYFKERKIEILKENYPQNTQLLLEIEFKHDLALLNKMASCDTGYSIGEIENVREKVIKNKKYVCIKSLKEKIRIFLILYFFPCYLKIMQCNNRK